MTLEQLMRQAIFTILASLPLLLFTLALAIVRICAGHSYHGGCTLCPRR
jgi:hypothetical protein